MWHLAAAGPALAPIQAADRLMVLTMQSNDGPGVTVWGVNPVDGTIVWRTILGTPWPVPLSPTVDGTALSTLGTDGQTVTISQEALAKGGFIVQPIPPNVDRKLPPGSLRRIDVGSLTIIVPSSSADQILVREGSSAFQRINLPAALGAPPLLWGTDLFAPGGDGRAYLIDPKTGASKAEPYVPPFDRTKPTHWLGPVKLEDEAVVLADTSGRIRRLVKQTDPRVHLALAGEADVGSAAWRLTLRLRGRPWCSRRRTGASGRWRGTISAPWARGRSMRHDRWVRSRRPGTHSWPIRPGMGPRFWRRGAQALVDRHEGQPAHWPPGGARQPCTLSGQGRHAAPPLAGRRLGHRPGVPLGILPSGGPWAVGTNLAVGSGPGAVRMILNKSEK